MAVHKREIRNPNDHYRLIFTVDEENKIVERIDKGWITRVQFKVDGMMDVTPQKQASVEA